VVDAATLDATAVYERLRKQALLKKHLKEMGY
jgi:quinol monooxygenase YgiN